MKPIGDIINQVMPKLDELAQRADELRKMIDNKIETTPAKQCDKHGVELPVDQEGTFSETWFCGEIVLVYGKCPKCEQERKDSLVTEKLAAMGIPEKVWHATFENFEVNKEDPKAAALAKAKAQSRHGRGFLILRGSPGTGKTHLAAAILKIHGGLFVTLHDLIGELRHTYDEGGQEKMVEKYRNVPCLVLDELDKSVKGADVQNILYRIFAHRYDKGLLTVITSNDTLDEILDTVGPRLTDRFRESHRVATMEWESHRKKK